MADPWWAAIEGQADQDDDAEHWVAVYSDLIATMLDLAHDDPSIERRIEEMRERLAYWEQRRRAAED